MCLDIKNNT